jgi:hypothetical protein
MPHDSENSRRDCPVPPACVRAGGRLRSTARGRGIGGRKRGARGERETKGLGATRPSTCGHDPRAMGGRASSDSPDGLRPGAHGLRLGRTAFAWGGRPSAWGGRPSPGADGLRPGGDGHGAGPPPRLSYPPRGGRNEAGSRRLGDLQATRLPRRSAQPGAPRRHAPRGGRRVLPARRSPRRFAGRSVGLPADGARGRRGSSRTGSCARAGAR